MKTSETKLYLPPELELVLLHPEGFVCQSMDTPVETITETVYEWEF